MNSEFGYWDIEIFRLQIMLAIVKALMAIEARGRE